LTPRHAGERLLQHRSGGRDAIGEGLIGRQRHLWLAVHVPGRGTLNLNATAAQRDLTSLLAVPDRDPVGIPATLRTADIIVGSAAGRRAAGTRGGLTAAAP